ncbi:MAG: ABC transporter ATP-binding protein [Microthrixaceae bacterium]
MNTSALRAPISEVAATDTALRADILSKRYGDGPGALDALSNVSLSVASGSFVAIMGPSGSGKSTLMHCLAGLDTPTSGMIEIAGIDISGLDERRLTELRRDRIGFIFQAFNLVATLTAAENIRLPSMLARTRLDESWYHEVVRRVGLEGRLGHRPSELSGGQQQRVAVARSLVGRPEVIFADEPTGNLDSGSGDEVLRLLRTAVDEVGQTIVMVTHDPGAAAYADRVVFLADGNVVDELEAPSASAVLDRMKRFGD